MSGPVDRMPLAAFLAAREAVFNAARAYEVVKPNCQSCSEFEMGHCKHFGAQIPKEFQTADSQCEHWTFDGIPF